MTAVPVVDLFAGPGGLGEGFASVRDAQGRSRFTIALSIEKEEWAHQTLTLRSFFRKFGGEPPEDYFASVRQEIPVGLLQARYSAEWQAAAAEARHLELGASSVDVVRGMVDAAVAGHDAWVLIGGPPCQAYSLVGRSRRAGQTGYSPDDDPRQTLYVEYLQLLADHAPPVFVMENVKGLLSATHRSQNVFERIYEDLADPARALTREKRTCRARRPRYSILPLTPPGSLLLDPADYVVRAEEFGVPQARHRVFLVGVRTDAGSSLPYLHSDKPVTVRSAIARLPRLRSGLTDEDDADASWLAVLRSAHRQSWFSSLDQEVRVEVRSAAACARLPKASRGQEFVKSRVSHSRLGGFSNHSARAHIRADVERYLFASAFARATGRSPELSDFPAALLPSHRSAAGAPAFVDRFKVQLPDRPSSTVTSHIAKDGHYYIHYDPTQARSLTVREAARLQTFPDDYFFCGPRTAQYHQVGNAVPPALAQQIAAAIATLF